MFSVICSKNTILHPSHFFLDSTKEMGTNNVFLNNVASSKVKVNYMIYNWLLAILAVLCRDNSGSCLELGAFHCNS